jgi:hypothetical protein
VRKYECAHKLELMLLNEMLIGDSCIQAKAERELKEVYSQTIRELESCNGELESCNGQLQMELTEAKSNTKDKA